MQTLLEPPEWRWGEPGANSSLDQVPVKQGMCKETLENRMRQAAPDPAESSTSAPGILPTPTNRSVSDSPNLRLLGEPAPLLPSENASQEQQKNQAAGPEVKRRDVDRRREFEAVVGIRPLGDLGAIAPAVAARIGQERIRAVRRLTELVEPIAVAVAVRT